MDAVKKTLQPLPGVAKVNVDFPKRLATVSYDGEFDTDDAIAKLAEAGYEASLVE